MRWTFGEEPLDETERYAAAVRRVTSLALRLEAPAVALAGLTDVLERAEAELQQLVPPDPRPRVGAAADADGRVYLDHSRDIGAFNPAFPVYELVVDGDRASGTVNFPLLYEGPPGLVHGGFLAVFFDAVIQHHNCDVGTAGKTTRLEVRYAAPTPLLTDLGVEVERATSGGRIESMARLHAGDRLCATATMRAVAGDRSALPAVSPRRPT